MNDRPPGWAGRGRPTGWGRGLPGPASPPAPSSLFQGWGRRGRSSCCGRRSLGSPSCTQASRPRTRHEAQPRRLPPSPAAAPSLEPGRLPGRPGRETPAQPGPPRLRPRGTTYRAPAPRGNAPWLPDGLPRHHRAQRKKRLSLTSGGGGNGAGRRGAGQRRRGLSWRGCRSRPAG